MFHGQWPLVILDNPNLLWSNPNPTPRTYGNVIKTDMSNMTIPLAKFKNLQSRQIRPSNVVKSTLTE